MYKTYLKFIFIFSIFAVLSLSNAKAGEDDDVPSLDKDDLILYSLNKFHEGLHKDEAERKILQRCNIVSEIITKYRHTELLLKNYPTISFVNQDRDNLLTLIAKIHLDISKKSFGLELSECSASLVFKILEFAAAQDELFGTTPATLSWLIESKNKTQMNFISLANEFSFSSHLSPNSRLSDLKDFIQKELPQVVD